MHEASLQPLNCFITLTYAPEHLPKGETLVKRHFQDFVRELRRQMGVKIRYFHCGEYGEQLCRPHYHAILFGMDFLDKKPWKVTEAGEQLYVSPRLDKIWGKGHCSVGNVTFESCAYVARYVCKKITGDAAEEHYKGKQPEYITMSRDPGIGALWWDKWHPSVDRHDSIVMNGHEMKPPRFYDKRLKKHNELRYDEIKQKREADALKPERIKENTPERLRVRGAVKTASFNLYKRNVPQ